jgi:hypothetical protein
MLRFPLLTCLVALSMLTGTSTGQDRRPPGAPLGTSPPGTDWIPERERKDFDWNLDVPRPELRMDQRHEIALKARVEAGDLEESDADHDLTLVTVVTDRDGEWLAASPPDRQSLASDVHEESALEFETYISLTPGRYVVWVVLEDETTGQRNVARKEIEVARIGNDPLPQAYMDLPAVEFARVEQVGTLRVRHFASDLAIPVPNTRPLDVELIATLSAPEQWPGGDALFRHTENMLAGLTVLSRLDLAAGSRSVTGLDLLRREVAFEQEGRSPLDRAALVEALERVNRSAISVDALTGRKDNPAFLRRYIEGRVASSPPDSSDDPLKVLILVAGVMRFEDSPDLSEVELEGRCDCRVFHLRFKQELQDLFDQVDDLLKPLDPPTWDIFSPRDFRRVIGEIVDDLGGS